MSVVGTLIFAVYFVRFGLPSRFPVSVTWIVGSMLFIYLYYLLANKVATISALNPVVTIGRYSLFYLVLSNILIFALRSSEFHSLGPATAFSVFLVVMAVCYYLAAMFDNGPTIPVPDTDAEFVSDLGPTIAAPLQ